MSCALVHGKEKGLQKSSALRQLEKPACSFKGKESNMPKVRHVEIGNGNKAKDYSPSK